MVSNRHSHLQCQLSPGKNGYQESKGTHPESSGEFVKTRLHTLRLAAFLCVSVSLCLCVQLTAQPIYAENQLPARGVDISYIVSMKNPTSHLYDIEMLIKGIRETSVS